MINGFVDEVGKYRKKKNSNTSKGWLKARHKHEYVECLYIIHGKPHHGTYCKLCGKIRNIMFLETERTSEFAGRFLSDEEIYEKDRHLERIHIQDFRQKYISR